MRAGKVSWLALFIALSVAGGMIKVPVPVSSVALDSFPALIGAVLLGPAAGALIGAFGHIVSALFGGFPMGPLHGIVAVEMAAVMWVFGRIYRSGRKWIALPVFVFLNGIVLPALFIPFMGMVFYVSSVPAIGVAALANGAAAYILLPRLVPLFKKRYGHFYA
ncbi:ECF transporter S component [Domibacillus sp. PGB-M46]|uniref:ECF transporter S component n=1 Tax=Domibacillus sp. PGB-M46 TaxID=2910255 RepID=UPI001F593465|nr:ECF transporter S component [Domibacillus sp. PGB-M46]MCI2254924.1 ECF transporter S component [Domibacillus sp. PGB-M46]